MISKSRLYFLAAAALVAFVVAACNTVSGAGRDIAALGRVVTSSADDVKRDIED